MRRGDKSIRYLVIGLVLAVLLTVSLPSPALAQSDATTVGTISLSPTYETISVYSAFSGDDDGDNQAVLEYRELPSGTWKPGVPMTPDRREMLAKCVRDGSTYYEDNPWKNQWRAVIFWLQPDTEYEVRVTYTDPDGMSGGPVTDTVRTLEDNPPSNGTTYYVSTTGDDTDDGLTEPTAFATIQHAADIVDPGDTVLIMPGTYSDYFDYRYNNNVYINRSGTEDNWITFRSYDMNDKAVIDGQGIVSGNFWIENASHIRIKGLSLTTPNPGLAGNIYMEMVNNIIIEDNEIFFNGTAWGHSGVIIRNRSEPSVPVFNILVQRNKVTSDDVRAEKFGIFVWGVGNHAIVVRENEFVGMGMKDGISGSWHKDTFVHDNYFEGPWDDGIELEGEGMNTAAWNNTVIAGHPPESGYPKMSLGAAPVTVGPYYVFRNVCVGASDSAIKMGNSSEGTTYFYHNTIYTRGKAGNGISFFGNNARLNNLIMRNNIVDVDRYAIENGEPSPDWSDCDLDYNAFYTDRNPFKWTGVIYNYDNFRAATGYESHGIFAEGGFVDPQNDDMSLQSTSPCIDAGVPLPGFNDENSPWPSSGYAPDIGAYEYNPSGAYVPMAPEFDPIGDKATSVGQLLEFAISATDLNNEPLTYSASNLPSGASFDTGTRTFSWTPSSGQDGTYPDVHFEVSDGALSDSENITITVGNQPPELQPIGNKSVNEGELLEFIISATDPNSDPLTYSASNLPSGASFDPGTRTFSWTPSSGQAGTYPNVHFEVSDGALTDSEDITITANGPPVLNAIGDKSVNEGELLEFTVSATDPNNDPLTYSASNLPTGASFDPDTETFSWTPSSGQGGSYPDVHFEVSDSQLTDYENITITVSGPPVLDPIGDKSVHEGQLLEFTISATDPNNDPLSYSANLTSLPAGAGFDPGTRTFSWTPSSGQAGTYPNVHFEVSDSQLTDYENITITVGNQPPGLDAIGDKSVNEGQLLEFTISATDPEGDPLSYSANLTSLPPGASFDPGTRTFSWTPSSGQVGTYANVHFEVSDGALTDSEDITITVTINNSPVLDAIGDKSVNEGELLEFTVSATDPEGDPLTYSASNLPSGASFDPGTHTFSWTPSSGQDGSYPNVHFTVSDGELTDSENITITVSRRSSSGGGGGGGGGSAPPSNKAPVLNTIGDKSVCDGQLLEFTVSAADPDDDPLTYSASNLPSGASFDSDTRTFSWTPDSGQAGTYPNVYFEVSDGKLADSEEITITVNNPPVLNTIGDKSITEGELLEFTVSGTDPEGDPLTCSASNLPSGASFDPDTRTFSWTPGSGQAGTYASVRFEVSDSALTDFEDITITVHKPDKIPPEVYEVVTSGVTPHSADIYWTTDEPSTSRVKYWASPSKLSPLDQTLVTQHVIHLTDLTPGTTYQYKALSTDEAGNIAVSPTHTLTTPMTPAAFVVSGLEISPAEVNIGEEITISVLVTNSSDATGNCQVTLTTSDGTKATEEIIDLAAGASQTADFTMIRNAARTFTIDVESSAAVDEVAMSGSETSFLIVNPRFDVENGGLASARINYQVTQSFQSLAEVEPVLVVGFDGNPLEILSLLSSSQLEPDGINGNLDYTPLEGWSSGTYTFLVQLYEAGKLLGSTQENELQVRANPEWTAKVVNWSTLTIIIGSTLIVILATVLFTLARRRDMLRGAH